ncbi:substrate-binding domain-containing protein [Acetomicrobium sp. S15 = DSM 107314]|uniref:substrate-binding domain-containing protein n=1 Tax=Acetomicrobium sp. S15 = DSM 107314 TaxID=2529858 RepID=UPI0018E1434F|nr:substrate-binding domain-containing protein [Acetomicrobium sp. S15 = DSM 107314]
MVKAKYEHLSIAEAWELLYMVFNEMIEEPSIEVPPEEGLWHVLADDVQAERNIPHHPVSAVDGYALKSDATSNASPATPAILKPHEYSWINTGGALPLGADAVAMVEDTSLKEDGDLYVYRALTLGSNVRPVGEDVTRGDVIAYEKDQVTPSLCALFVACGVRRIKIRRRPKSVYIPTGDEIVSPENLTQDQELPPGKVIDSNSALLRSLFDGWGMSLDVHSLLPDDKGLIREAIRKAAGQYDLILVGAGSAKGEKDYTAPAIAEEGKLLLHWLRMRPGRPVIIGEVNGKPVVGLPGFSMSTMAAAWTIVYPILSLLSGMDISREEILRRAISAVEAVNVNLLLPHSSPQGVEEWLRLKGVQIGEMRYVWPLKSGASSISSMAGADAFALLPAEATEYLKGEPVLAYFVLSVPWESRALFQGSDDPAFRRLVRYVRHEGADLAIRNVGSLGGIAALSRGEAHMAACHLLDPATGRYNDSYIDALKPHDRKWIRKVVFLRSQGFILKEGNPKGIKGVEDLARKDVRIINRQPGAGTRVLLDYLLRESGISPSQVQGYNVQTNTHIDAAARVAWGLADVAVGVKAAADAWGLDFIPITWEPYELVIPEEHIGHPGVQALLDAIENPMWRKEVEELGGYRWPE